MARTRTKDCGASALLSSGCRSPAGGHWAAFLAVLTAYVGTGVQAVGVHREFSGVMAKPWRMVALSIGAVITLNLIHRGESIYWGRLTVLDWTHAVIIAGCLQTLAVRLTRIMRALDKKARQREPADMDAQVR